LANVSKRLPDSIADAAAWLASTPVAERPRPLVPALRRRFDLTALQAVDAIRKSHKLKAAD
jgi:hypothetical protein